MADGQRSEDPLDLNDLLSPEVGNESSLLPNKFIPPQLFNRQLQSVFPPARNDFISDCVAEDNNRPTAAMTSSQNAEDMLDPNKIEIESGIVLKSGGSEIYAKSSEEVDEESSGIYVQNAADFLDPFDIEPVCFADEADNKKTDISFLVSQPDTVLEFHPHECEECLRRFESPEQLTFHRLNSMHTGHRPFRCEKCLKTFPKIDSLRSHVLKYHIKDERSLRLFQCELCDYSFWNASQLKRHELELNHQGNTDSHSNDFDDDQHKCKICHKSFLNPLVLRVHMDSAHHDCVFAFKCNVCLHVFSKFSSLTAELN